MIVSLFIVSQAAIADIVVFDSYKNTYTMEKDNLHVTKHLRLKNVGTSPIIPGEIHFKISQDDGEGPSAPGVNNFVVENKYGQKLDTRQIKKETEMDLVFTIWDPLLPQFFYDFTMEYDITFDPKGLMFYSIDIPQEKTTISVRQSETEFIIPKRYFVTFAPDAEVESSGENKVIRWEDDSNLQFEYSIVPMPRMGFPAVNLFWALVICLLLTIFIIRIVRNRSQ